jgi:septation ring formation regulator EzrA
MSDWAFVIPQDKAKEQQVATEKIMELIKHMTEIGESMKEQEKRLKKLIETLTLLEKKVAQLQKGQKK